MNERRRFVRKRALLGGLIEFPGRPTLECVIRDLSQAGARLRCDQPIALPDVVGLVIDRSGERRNARIVWRGETECGVVFEANILPFEPRRH
jgi:hypothetical protein